MKKTGSILLGIILIAFLTGITLYKKHQKTQIKAEQEATQREQAEKIVYQQKEAKIAKYKEEQQKRSDSINQAQKAEFNEGMELLKQAKEKINKEIETENKKNN